MQTPDSRNDPFKSAKNEGIDPGTVYKSFRSFCYSGGQLSATTSDLTVESLLEIRINGKRYTTIMFTPDLTLELVVGFLFTEGIIRNPGDMAAYRISREEEPGGETLSRVEVKVSAERTAAYSLLDSRRISYSSCGICGTETYEQMQRGLGRVKSRMRFSMEVLEGLPKKLEALQPLYNRTGGAHAAILFDAQGGVVVHAEDMGRHNAVDKVIGAALMAGTDPSNKILLSSGRASLEMILKSARAGFPLFVAMSRPTSKAVDAAKFYNITLMDLSRNSNRIYSHVRRIETF